MEHFVSLTDPKSVHRTSLGRAWGTTGHPCPARTGLWADLPSLGSGLFQAQDILVFVRVAPEASCLAAHPRRVLQNEIALALFGVQPRRRKAAKAM